jgi:hypothetical protein
VSVSSIMGAAPVVGTARRWGDGSGAQN